MPGELSLKVGRKDTEEVRRAMIRNSIMTNQGRSLLRVRQSLSLFYALQCQKSW
jgi:hypothetical protein